jgi:hypothetical protein
MIVRSAFKCLTCDQPHTVRIGMGQETRQVHHFPCMSCGEDMVVALNVDYKLTRHWAEAVKNAEQIQEVPDAPIMNVDANFIVPVEERHKDFAFPRLDQLDARMQVAKENSSLIAIDDIPGGKRNERPFRRPDFEDEWRQLKTTWSLHRRGRVHLIQDRLRAASETYYGSEPLNSVQDWIWRFLFFFSQPAFEMPFRSAFDQIRPLMRHQEFADFAKHYNKISAERGERYFELMKSYFEAYSEFSQVHFDVVRGLDISGDNCASSIDFSRTKMFYGNAFEVLASSVDILAYFSNLNAGRPFDKFQNLTQKEYLRLDKPSRFGPFATMKEFDDLCIERDNQLRNASHHGGTRFNAETQIITFHSGKGGLGQVQEIGYANYLVRCDRLFLQIMTLLRMEIMMCQISGLRMPL